MELLQDGNGSAAPHCKYVWLLHLDWQLLWHDTLDKDDNFFSQWC